MSVFFSDYLEELFPEKEPKLYPKDDPFKKYKQRLLVETVGSAVSTKLQKVVVIGAKSVSWKQSEEIIIFTNFVV